MLRSDSHSNPFYRKGFLQPMGIIDGVGINLSEFIRKYCRFPWNPVSFNDGVYSIILKQDTLLRQKLRVEMADRHTSFRKKKVIKLSNSVRR